MRFIAFLGEHCVKQICFVFLAVICPPPLVSEFGALSYRKIESGDKFVFQETISFSCLLPLALFGSETATCQADGSWTELPECKCKSYNIVLVAGNFGIVLTTYLERTIPEKTGLK